MPLLNRFDSLARAGGRWLQRRRPDLLCSGVLLLAAVAAIRPLWQSGVPNRDDMLVGIYRVFTLDRSWHQGVLYPRTALDINFGFGGPLFQYYPPLASYLALPWHWLGLGWVEDAKMVFSLALLLAGAGMYGYASWLLGSHRAGLVAGLVYMLAPYLLLDIYERGAAAEVLALGLLPWLFWAMHRILRGTGLAGMWVGAFLVALLMLAHHITALFVFPCLVLYLVVVAWLERAWGRLPAAALAFACGLGLSAFFWLPALTEQGFAQIQGRMLTGSKRPAANLIALSDAVQPALSFDYWGAQRFRLGLWAALLGAGGIVALPFQPRRRRGHLLLLTGLLLAAVVLQTRAARPFWQDVPLVAFIQFPWRLLGLAAFCIALLAGSLAGHARLAGRARWGLAIAIMGATAYTSLANLDPGQSSLWYRISSSTIGTADLYERGSAGFALFGDYSPVGVHAPADGLARPRRNRSEMPPPLAATPAVVVESESAAGLRLRVDAPQAFTLRLPRIYFPDWQILAGDRRLQARAAGVFGLAAADLPAGSYQVVARFTETPLRTIADCVSCLCLIGLAVAALRSSRTRWAGAVLAAMMVLGAALALTDGGLVAPPRHPVPYAASLEDGISLVGYHLEPASWNAGETVTVRLYWLVSQIPANDYRVLLRVVTPDGTTTAAQSASRPGLGFDPTVRWDPGELVVDEQQLRLDGKAAAATYQLQVELQRTDTQETLAVNHAASLLPGDRIHLTDVQIGQAAADPGAQAAAGQGGIR